MKLNFKNVAFGLMLTGGFAGNAMAAGTEAGTEIDNKATLTFTSGSVVGQQLISSPTGNGDLVGSGDPGAAGEDTTFLVDRKLDVEVAYPNQGTLGEVSVEDGAEGFLTFVITNNGNADQGVFLTALVNPSTGNPHGANDPHDDPMSDVQICYEDAAGTDTVTGIVGNLTCTTAGDLDVRIPDVIHDGDADRNVYIVGTATGLDADDRSVYALVAQPTETDGDGSATIIADDSGSADIATGVGAVQDVFADAAPVAPISIDLVDAADVAENGQQSATGTFVIAVAELTLSKTSLAVWDEVNCANTEAAFLANASNVAAATLCTSDANSSGNPKSIPGAYLRYTLSIINNGNLAVTGASISDALQAEITYAASSVLIRDGDGAVLAPPADGSGSVAQNVSVTDISIAASDGAAAGPDEVHITFFVKVD